MRVRSGCNRNSATLSARYAATARDRASRFRDDGGFTDVWDNLASIGEVTLFRSPSQSTVVLTEALPITLPELEVNKILNRNIILKSLI